MNKEIIVSIASIPARLAKLPAVVKNLQRNSVPPDHIYIWLCRHYKRLKTSLSEDAVPKSLLNDPRVTVAFGEDWGPATKFIPLLGQEHNPEQLVVVTDDDQIVPRSFIEDLVRAHAANPRRVYGYRGRVLTKTGLYNDCEIWGMNSPRPLDQPKQVDIITVTGGIVFARAQLEGYAEFWQATFHRYPEVFNADDIVLNSFLKMNHCERWAIPLKAPVRPLYRSWRLRRRFGLFFYPVQNERHDPDSLWTVNADGLTNDYALRVFKDLWK